MIPGWPYSLIGALGPGRTSQTAVLDTVRRLKRIRQRPALIDGFLGQTGRSLRTRTTADARAWPFRLCIATTWDRVHPRLTRRSA
jgi:hypothetical protein